MSDGEGAVGKLKPYLNTLGIEVDISGAGGHVSRVERRIQVIKERVRAHICGRLPFTLTLMGLSMLILYCASRLNYQHSGTRPGGLSPREAFSGQRVDGSRDFRVAFGDYVQSTTPNTNNTMTSRTDDCIAMLPTGNRTGSVKMFSIATGKIVSRDNFKILPMPESVVNHMNKLAANEGRRPSGKLDVFSELQYQVGGDKTTNMPTFMPVSPPNQEIVEDSESQLGLADTQLANTDMTAEEEMGVHIDQPDIGVDSTQLAGSGLQSADAGPQAPAAGHQPLNIGPQPLNEEADHQSEDHRDSSRVDH